MNKTMKKFVNRKRKHLVPDSTVYSSESGYASEIKTTLDSGALYRSDITWKEAKPNESIIGDVSDPHVFNSLINLISAVIKSGLKEHGESYLDFDSTLKLLAICNLEASAIKRNLYKLLNNQKLGV